MSEFTHLHVHSDASIKDGLGSVARTVSTAKRLGFKRLALTDHGTLANAIRFSIECNQQGIQPILGVEAYLSVDENIGHITLLADGNHGFSNLIKLTNLAHKSSFRSPAITIDQLVNHSKDIICLTGCISSPLQQMPIKEAISLASRLKYHFEDRLFAEVMAVSDNPAHFSRGMALANNLRIKPILTNDVHFAEADDYKVHPILTQIKAGFSYQSDYLYMQSVKQLMARGDKLGLPAKSFDMALDNAGNLAKAINSVNLKSTPSLPYIPNSDINLRTNAEAGLRKLLSSLKFLTLSSTYMSRMNHELKIIKDMDYSTYFLILLDLINFAHENDIKIGPGRGSGAGSLVLFLLGITKIDPIEYELEFERFLNPGRKGMPDVDVDFESERRSEVLDYAATKYDAVPIMTYSTYSHKSLVRDLGRGFRIPQVETNEAAERGEGSKEFKKFCANDPLVLQSYNAMMGQIRHKGKHAGGVIITDREVPIERTASGRDELASSWTEGSNNELSYAGVVKFDLLGLSVLSALAELENNLGEKPELPFDNHRAFKIFRNGDLGGIFQFSGSPGIRDLTIKLSPTKFEDLSAITALFRPGPLDSGMTEKFYLYKDEPREVPLHLQKALEETYGVIVYQEQMMKVFQLTIGGTIGDADLARRVLVKSKPDDLVWKAKFNALKTQFLDGCKSKKMTKASAENLWHELETFARYGFNKSHAVSYSMISWQCAWWKWKHPTYFYAAMLNIDPGNSQRYIFEIAKRDLHIVPPHVNESLATKHTADANTIYLPFVAIKFLGNKGANELVKLRKSFGGSFPSIKLMMEQLNKRAVNGRARKGLLALGAFAGIDGSSDDLSLKDTDLPSSIPERHQAHLGYVIPSSAMLKKFDQYTSEGHTVGIIQNIKNRTSKHGPYRVFYLTPSGVFWSRKMDRFKVGDIIAVDIHRKSAKGIRVKELSYV